MKRVFSRITAANLRAQALRWALVLGAVTALAACSSNPDSANVSGDVKVLAPMNDSKSSKYSLQFIELSGLSNLQEVSGRFVRFFFGPRISGGHLSGSAPKGRFLRNSEGNFIPADDLSQQMVVIYAHMQKLAQLDEAVGAQGVNTWPRDIGVGVRVKGGMSNNAFYDGKTDSMLFVPYTQDHLPIAANGGILAHEHFHSLFYKLVLKGVAEDASVHDRALFLKDAGIEEVGGRSGRVEIVPEESSEEQTLHKYYHSSLLRGINEGLADFWGWMYTGNPDFIAASLPQEQAARSLKVQDVKSVTWLPKTSSVKRAVGIYLSYDENNVKQYLTGYSYTVGTQFSRVMKRFTDVSAEARGLQDQESRKQVAAWLVKMLPLLRADVEKTQDGSYYSATQFIESLASVVPDLQEKECQFLVEVLNNTSGSDTKKTCKQDGSWKFVTE